MKKLNNILKSVRQTIENNTKESSLWLQSSKQDKDGAWHNQNATVSDIVNCTDDDMFFNVWARLEEGTAEELDTFIEEQLIPNGLRILADTEMSSKDGTSVRFMIARPLNDENLRLIVLDYLSISWVVFY